MNFIGTRWRDERYASGLVSALAAAALTACLRQPAPTAAYIRAEAAADPPPASGPVVLRVPDAPPAFEGQLKPLPGA